jgi:branched-chain amino acid aminotransferase
MLRLTGMLPQPAGIPHNSRMDQPVAFLNGQWIPASAAAVPIGDAGFVQGTTVAEQLRTFAGRLFRLDEHLARLAHSLKIVGIGLGMTFEQLAETAGQLIARNHPLLAHGDDLGLSIVVTPGIYPTYAPPGPSHPTVCLHTYPLPFHLWAEKYRQGQALVTTAVEQVSPHCWPAGLKCRSRMHYHLADKQAAAIEPQARALLLDAQGFVTEASTANLLIYNAAEGLASPPSTKILRGISLATVMELAGRFDIHCRQRELSTDDVASAGEVLLTSTPMCLLPVTRFNGRPIGDGRPGPVFHRLIAAWSEMVGVDIVAQAALRPAKVSVVPE